MFASDILSSLELPLSAPKIPDNMIIRPLRIDDYKRGYLQLLSQLTFVGDVSEEQYRQRYSFVDLDIINRSLYVSFSLTE